MIRRLALCLTLVPGISVARSVQHPAPPAPPAPAPPLTPPAMCEDAIGETEAGEKLPQRVLCAIAVRESGRIAPDPGRARPWPWTINYDGTGHYYASKDEA